jgi:hypothetical protein
LISEKKSSIGGKISHEENIEYFKGSMTDFMHETSNEET